MGMAKLPFGIDRIDKNSEPNTPNSELEESSFSDDDSIEHQSNATPTT